MESRITRAWQLYEQGRAYNNRLVPNQYSLVNTNIEFFAGNQWIHMPQTPAMRKLPKPTFNIIKRVASLFVASLTSSAATISFDELSYYAGDPMHAGGNTASEGDQMNTPGALPGSGADEERTDANGAVIATAEVQNLLEKFKFDYRIREALFDGAQTGDYCAHFWWDPNAIPFGGAFGPYRGEIRMELVDGINVMFGNPNTPDTERQPYILIVGRDNVENLRAEKAMHDKKKRGDRADWAESLIQPDSEYEFQAGVGGKTELEADAEGGKALYVYLYEKKTTEQDILDPVTGEPVMEQVLDDKGEPVQVKDKDGRPVVTLDGEPVYKMKKARQLVTTVYVSKCTRGCTIFENVDTGLSRYPIAWGNWEKQKNQYHGRALVTGIVPNQIFINTMFAMVMRHLQMMGFPKTVYNADLISQWNNEVGLSIGVRGLQPGQKISEVAYNLQPADMSNQIIQAIDKAFAYTKDCLGATDAQMGNVQPDNTSALMVLQSSAEVPLENTRSALYEWMEDVGAILLDMMGTYYGERPIVREREFTEIMNDPNTGAPMINPMTGTMMTNTVTRRVVELYDFTKFKHLWFNVRVNAGAATYYSEIAMVQTLDNLRRDGTLEVIDYLERIPDKLVPRKAELIRELRQRTAMVTGMPNSGGGIATPTGGATAPGGIASATAGELSEDKLLAEMPGSTQAKFATLPTSAKNALLNKAALGQ